MAVRSEGVAPNTSKELDLEGGRASPARAGRPWSLDDLPVAVLVFHADAVVAVNERWTALTGLDLAASRGDGWLSATRRSDRAAMSCLPEQAVGGDDAFGDWSLSGPGGRGVVWVQARAHHVDGSSPSACLITFAEIAPHETTHEKLVHQATHDGLTGLLNRAAFIEEVHDALQRDAPVDTCTAVLFIDLDRFKHVNDRLGHQAGDTLLAVACRRILSSLRPSEIAGRLGGDEVGVLCASLESRHSAVRLAERIVATLEEPFTVHDEVVLIGASIGVAFSDANTLTAEMLVDNADTAMYRAKAEGRSRCVVYASTDEPELLEPCLAEVDTSLAHVAVSIARGERRVNDLWRNSIDLRDDTLAVRLARASQALRVANQALREDDAIG